MRLSLTLLVAAACAAGVVAQQSLIPFQGQVLAFYPNPVDSAAGLGDLAPNCGGDRFGASTQGNAVIDGSGNVLFRGRLVSNTGATITPTYLQFAYFYGDSRGNLTKVLRGGDPEPSGTIPGAIISTSTAGNGLSTDPPRVTDNGLMMFTANFWDNGVVVTTANDTALYHGLPGNFLMIAREGDAAPGCGGATYNNFGGLSTQTSGANSAGWAIFQSTFPNSVVPVPPVTAANNGGVFRRDPAGAVSLLFRKGDLTPNGEQLGTSLPFLFQMNTSGTLVCDVAYVAGTGTPVVTTANDRAVWLVDPAGNISTLVREGDPCPALPGTFYANAGNTWSYNSGSSTFNVNGEFLSWTPLTGAVVTGVDDGALVAFSAASHAVVFRRGELAPDVQGTHPGAALDVPNFASLTQNDSGRVAFSSVMVGGGVATTNDTGVWTGSAGNLQLVIREGDVAPGTGGLTFGNTTAVNIYMNANGSLFTSNTLSNGDSSVWLWDPVLGLQCLVRNGDPIEVQPGVFRTMVGQTGGIQFTNDDGRPLMFANDGTIGLRVFNTDSATLSGTTYASGQIMSVRVGTLTGIANKISQAAGGTHNLYLNAGTANAGFTYVVAGSASGTFPGTQIGLINVPLNLDFYTTFTLDNANILPFVNTFGVLNPDGRALAQIVIPPAVPGILGVTVDHAYGVLDGGGNLVFASEPASLQIIF